VLEIDQGGFGVITTEGGLISAEVEGELLAFFSNKCSPATIRTYLETAREFLGLVSQEIGHLCQLKRQHLIFYQSWLTRRGLAEKTILRKLSAISSLCKHLAHENIIDRDLSYGLNRPKAHNKKITADFTDKEVSQIFSSLDPTSISYTSHKALLAVGFYTGLRSAEIRMLKVKNVAEVKGHRVLALRIKGNKPHEVPLVPFVYRSLQEHLQTLDSLGLDIKDGEQWLFPCLRPLRNTPISAKGLSKVLQKAMARAGIVPS
jgi:site-specific recombinase XerD